MRGDFAVQLISYRISRGLCNDAQQEDRDRHDQLAEGCTRSNPDTYSSDSGESRVRLAEAATEAPNHDVVARLETSWNAWKETRFLLQDGLLQANKSEVWTSTCVVTCWPNIEPNRPGPSVIVR